MQPAIELALDKEATDELVEAIARTLAGRPAILATRPADGETVEGPGTTGEA